MRAIPFGIAAWLAMACGEPATAVIDGPSLTLMGLERRVPRFSVCVDGGRRRGTPEVRVVIEAFVERGEGSTEPMVVGMEREHRDEARGIVQTAFARLGDASELRQEWKERPILCEERDLFFRVVEGPADATVHVEWIVTAKVLDDPRARLWLTAVR